MIFKSDENSEFLQESRNIHCDIGDFMCFVWEVNPSIARSEALMIVSDICICAKTTSLSGWQRRTRSWMATSILCKEADTQNMRFLWDICWRLKEQSPSPLVHPSHPHRGKSRSELPPRDLQRWKPCCGPHLRAILRGKSPTLIALPFLWLRTCRMWCRVL